MNFVKFLLSQHFFDISFLNILWTVAQTPIKHTIFWKSMMRSFRWIEINCLNILCLLLRPAHICKKCTILGSLRTIIQEGKKENRQMTPFFSSTFWALTVCDIHFCIWKMSKFIFMGSPLWFILVCKLPEIWRWKLWDQNFLLFNSGNIHIKESKKPGFTFSIELRTAFVWSHGLYSLVYFRRNVLEQSV